jgi:hypothetical protein
MGMPQHVESDLRNDAGARTGFAHRPQLFGALPAASVIALEQHIGGERPQINRSISSGASPVSVTWRTRPLLASRIVSVSTSQL